MNMKKIILVLPLALFLAVSIMIDAGDSRRNGSQSSNLDESSESSGDSSESTSKKRKHPGDEAILIFNEATNNYGDRPHLEKLARRYKISMEEVTDTISGLVSNGEIDIEKALKDRDEAEAALERLHKALKTYSPDKKKI